ncbi:MAG: WD40/YVTN/BNR-like repeat-containing protein [Gammaproteobacteria bacterium]
MHAEREGERALFDVWFANEGHGLAVGAYGLLLESTDGGEHWMRRTLAIYQAGTDGEADGKGVAAGRGGDPSAFDLPATDLHLNHIAATDSGRLYLAAERGTVFSSDDRGRSWRALPSPYAGSFSGVLPLDDNAALVFGLRGHLYRWDRAGWTAIPTGTDETLTAGVRLSDGTLVLAGLGGVVLLSRDGGQSFTPQLEPDRAGFAAIAGSGPRALFLVGERGIRRLVPILTAVEAARE